MDQLATATLGGLAIGLLVGVLLPLRWGVGLAALATIGYAAMFIAKTPDHHPVPMVAFLFLLVVVPQIIAPPWAGLGLGAALRKWTTNRLKLRFTATIGVLLLVAAAHELLQADPRWKGATEKSGEHFVRGHAAVAAKVGPVRSATAISTTRRIGDRLPFSKIQYYVRGERGASVVVVDVSGRRAAPAFRIDAIRDEQ